MPKGKKYELVRYDGIPICIILKNKMYKGMDVAQYLSPDEGASDVVSITEKQVLDLLAGKKIKLPPRELICDKCLNEFMGHNEKLCSECSGEE